MTNTKQTLDYATERHLDAWLARNLTEDEAWLVRRAMITLAASNPDWLDRGWWRVYEEARCR